MTTELGLFVKDEKVVVSSRKVAEVFEKRHKDVLEAIKALGCSEEFNRRNFGPIEYTDARGRTQPEIIMTRDGFTFLAMGFTGAKAAEFKERYIAAFNEMERRLQHGDVPAGVYIPDFTDPVKAALAWAESEKQRLTLTAKIEEDRPKVLFADAVATSDSDILVGELAKILTQNGIPFGQNQLYAWLRKNDYCMKKGSNHNMPTQKAMNMGLFKVKKTVSIRGDGGIAVYKTAKVTGKGQIYFINLFKNQKYEGSMKKSQKVFPFNSKKKLPAIDWGKK